MPTASIQVNAVHQTTTLISLSARTLSLFWISLALLWASSIKFTSARFLEHMTVTDPADGSNDFKTLAPTCPVPNSDGKPCSCCQNLANVEVRLSEAESLLASLKAQRLPRKSDINELHVRIIGRVPLEIASYIFEIYVNMYSLLTTDGFAREQSMAVTRAPLRLGSVCRKWRSIAWSSPQLWKTLAINIRNKNHAMTASLVLEWLGRTGALPLSLQLYASPGYDTFPSISEHDDAVALIKIVNRFFPRCESVDIEMPEGLLTYVDGAGTDEIVQVPSILRHLRLSGEEPHNDDGDPKRIFLDGKSAPKHYPTHISLYCVALEEFSVEWSNLTHFNAGWLYVEECLEVIQQAPRLENCALYDIHGLRNEPICYSPIVHSVLRSFRVSEMEEVEGAIKILLDHLKLPSLQEFHYFGEPDDTSLLMPTDSLISLLLRSFSQAQLTTLQLHDPILTDDELFRILYSIPSLTTLRLSLWVQNNIGRLFTQLSKTKPADADHEFLPNLQTLRFWAPRTFPWGTLPDIFYTQSTDQEKASGLIEPSMLQRKTLQISLLLIGNMDTNDCIDEQTLFRLRELQKQGISLSVLQFYEDDSISDDSYVCQTYEDDENDERIAVDFIAKSESFHRLRNWRPSVIRSYLLQAELESD